MIVLFLLFLNPSHPIFTPPSHKLYQIDTLVIIVLNNIVNFVDIYVKLLLHRCRKLASLYEIKVIWMKEIKRREIELLAKICYQNNLPLKLAKDLLKEAEKLSYENVSQGGRIKEYQDLINFHIKNIDSNNQ